MRNASSMTMVDRSAWDQSFIDDSATDLRPTIITTSSVDVDNNNVEHSDDDDDDDRTTSAAAAVGNCRPAVLTAAAGVPGVLLSCPPPRSVSPRTRLLVWNCIEQSPQQQQQQRSVKATNLINGFVGCHPATNSGFVRHEDVIASPSNCNGHGGRSSTSGRYQGHVMLPETILSPADDDEELDGRIYENTAVDDWSKGNNSVFSQPPSPARLPLTPTSAGDTFLSHVTSCILAQRLPVTPTGHTPEVIGDRCPSLSSTSDSTSCLSVSSFQGSNGSSEIPTASCTSTTAVAASLLPPVRCWGLPSDSGNGSEDEHFLFAGSGDTRRTSSSDVTVHPGSTTATAGAQSRRDESSSYSRIASFLPAWDAERLETVYFRLAACGFYYGRMSMDEAAERLSRFPVGTFLLRDSSDERFLFSISVQTCRGTTSIRICFRSGLFRLDCTPDQEYLMPTFDCVLRLVSHYVRLCGGGLGLGGGATTGTGNGMSVPPPPTRSVAAAQSTGGGNSYVFLESSGRRDTPVLLRTPLRRDRPERLVDACRRACHRALGRRSVDSQRRDTLVDRLPVVPSLKKFLKDYPYEL